MVDRILFSLLLASLFYIEALLTKINLLLGIEWNPILINIGPDRSMVLKMIVGTAVTIGLIILSKSDKPWLIGIICITGVILWNLIMLARFWK